jgi:phytoene synthase
LAGVVSTTTEPALGAIRLAWWRERLQELDAGAAPIAEPRLRAIGRQLLSRGISGGELAQLEDAWRPLLDPFPWGEAAADGLRSRGRILFGIGARLLGGKPATAEDAGALWSLVDGADHCSDPQSREFLLGPARTALIQVPGRLPREVRPLTTLAALAAHDLQGGTGGARRIAVALAHRMFGTIPRRS